MGICPTITSGQIFLDGGGHGYGLGGVMLFERDGPPWFS